MTNVARVIARNGNDDLSDVETWSTALRATLQLYVKVILLSDTTLLSQNSLEKVHAWYWWPSWYLVNGPTSRNNSHILITIRTAIRIIISAAIEIATSIKIRKAIRTATKVATRRPKRIANRIAIFLFVLQFWIRRNMPFTAHFTYRIKYLTFSGSKREITSRKK